MLKRTNSKGKKSPGQSSSCLQHSWGCPLRVSQEGTAWSTFNDTSLVPGGNSVLKYRSWRYLCGDRVAAFTPGIWACPSVSPCCRQDRHHWELFRSADSHAMPHSCWVGFHTSAQTLGDSWAPPMCAVSCAPTPALPKLLFLKTTWGAY